MPCYRLSKRTAPREKKTCKTCSEEFISIEHQGKMPLYCSKKCLRDTYNSQKNSLCVCGKSFVSKWRSRSNSYEKSCSLKCSSESRKRGENVKCPNCGEYHYLQQSKLKKEGNCCSRDCSISLYRGDNCNKYKGGKYVEKDTGVVFVNTPTNPTVSNWYGEHRFVVSKFLGRVLLSQEFIIHINGDKTDNSIGNLFICTNSEFSSMRQGGKPWPTKSNLIKSGE